MAIPSTQTAAVIPSSGPDGTLSVEISNTHPVPIPGDKEALIKLEFSGVCHSDVHSIRGDTPMSTDVAGHEGVGKVIRGLRYPMALNMRNNYGSNLFYETVGSGMDENLWIGQMVGIRSTSRSNIAPERSLSFLLGGCTAHACNVKYVLSTIRHVHIKRMLVRYVLYKS